MLLLAKQMEQQFAEAVQCVCVFSVITAPEMKFQKVPNPGLCMPNKDAIPTTEECKNCGNPSAEELGESKEPVVWLILTLSCCRNNLLPEAALLCWQCSQTAAGGSACLAETIQPPSAKLLERNSRASRFYRLGRRSSQSNQKMTK